MLTFIGRGAAFNPAEGNNSAYFRSGSQLLLIDCGENVFTRLVTGKLLDGITEVTIVISHLHSDHCGSLGTFVHYCIYALGCKPTIALPADPEYREQVTTLLTLFAAPPDCYHLVSDSDVSGFAGVRSIRYIPTFHAPLLKCYSFSIETENGLIFYSADTATEKTLCDFIHDHPDVKEIYIDANDSTAPDSVHLNIDKLYAALPPEYRAITYMMHIPSVKCAEKGLALGFKIVQ